MSDFESTYKESLELMLSMKMLDSKFDDLYGKYIDLFIETVIDNIGEDHRESLHHFIFESDFGKHHTWFQYLNVKGDVKSADDWWELEFNPYEFTQRFVK